MIYQVGHRAQCGKCFLASLGPTCSSKDIRENELMNLYLFMAKKGGASSCTSSSQTHLTSSASHEFPQTPTLP